MQPAAQLLVRWGALPKAIRLVVTTCVLGALALTITAAIVAHPARTPLFAAPLHPDQIGEVEERLAAWRVPFTPTSENVVVDAVRRNDLLLRLSLAGVPHPHLASTGEALANIGVLTPQAVIEAQARAGLSGDIEAGLRGIDGVDDARVIVAPAKAPEFADESTHDASASVRLQLRSGTRLSREAVAGIRAFVAASVPELEAARVTILDDRGIALGDDAAGSDDASDLQHSLQSALDSAFGTGAAIVRVRAEYDAARTSERVVRRAPVGVAPIVRAQHNESYDGDGKRYRGLEAREDRGSETHESLALVPAGVLKRLSTAVFVDQDRALDLAKVRELSGATLGYDARRGDTLAVEALDFHRELVAKKDAWWLLYGAIVPLAPALVLAIGLVACVRVAAPTLASLVQALVERAIVERASKAASGFPPARVRSMLEREPPHAAAAIISALPAATATAVLELYPPHEREAIVDRMQRRHSPLIPDADELLRRHV
ncbi:MAG: flagellar M-ring protein FliF C-terminal domain-containing protein [Candidatus Cybelea sp.]